MLKVTILCVCIQTSNSSFTPSPLIGQRWVLVLETAVVRLEDPTAHYLSPLMHSDRGEEYPKVTIMPTIKKNRAYVLVPPAPYRLPGQGSHSRRRSQPNSSFSTLLARVVTGGEFKPTVNRPEQRVPPSHLPTLSDVMRSSPTRHLGFSRSRILYDDDWDMGVARAERRSRTMGSSWGAGPRPEKNRDLFTDFNWGRPQPREEDVQDTTHTHR